MPVRVVPIDPTETGVPLSQAHARLPMFTPLRVVAHGGSPAFARGDTVVMLHYYPSGGVVAWNVTSGNVTSSGDERVLVRIADVVVQIEPSAAKEGKSS